MSVSIILPFATRSVSIEERPTCQEFLCPALLRGCVGVLNRHFLVPVGWRWDELGWIAEHVSGLAVDGCKEFNLLWPSLSSSYPFVEFRVVKNPMELTTANYDKIAITYLALFLYPLVIGWAIYALQHYTYKSWYSWLISNLANAVYVFSPVSSTTCEVSTQVSGASASESLYVQSLQHLCGQHICISHRHALEASYYDFEGRRCICAVSCKVAYLSSG